MVAANVGHDKIVGLPVKPAGSEHRVVHVSGGQFPGRAAGNGRNGRRVGDDKGVVQIRGAKSGVRAQGAHPVLFLRVGCRVHIMIQQQWQAVESGGSGGQFRTGAPAMVNTLRIKAQSFPAGDFMAIIRVHGFLADVRHGHM